MPFHHVKVLSLSTTSRSMSSTSGSRCDITWRIGSGGCARDDQTQVGHMGGLVVMPREQGSGILSRVLVEDLKNSVVPAS